MRQQLTNGEDALSFSLELWPVPCDRLVDVEEATIDEYVDTQSNDALCAREHVDNCVLFPCSAGSGIFDPAPCPNVRTVDLLVRLD